VAVTLNQNQDGLVELKMTQVSDHTGFDLTKYIALSTHASAS